jgi:hypothetical protein
MPNPSHFSWFDHPAIPRISRILRPCKCFVACRPCFVRSGRHFEVIDLCVANHSTNGPPWYVQRWQLHLQEQPRQVGDILPLKAFVIRKTEPSSCFCCKIDILWVAHFTK